jgi:hypothetical protein
MVPVACSLSPDAGAPANRAVATPSLIAYSSIIPIFAKPGVFEVNIHLGKLAEYGWAYPKYAIFSLDKFADAGIIP